MTTDEAAAATVTPAPTGLRERKKQRTRGALVRTAFELFTRQGYDETTIDEIVEAVDVSQRTFFRYFANKEEVAFATQSSAEALCFDALCARPADEAPLTALRNAVLDGWDRMGETIEELVPTELHLRMYQVIESSPTLLAVHLRRTMEMEERLAREIARREGLDIDQDPRPRLVVAMVGGVIRVTGMIWGEGDDLSTTALRDIAAHQLDHVGPALAEHWNKNQ
ncbi:TetR family transcriptional regulator [Streptomyces coffeae]|uniref:TetR family transcriptional regulator n=1 Tax=Streptomyces coffeae TaxID=621382 RepID=UPI0027DD7AB8|nr:TetR family transcriptional regulator [Streptomyces coffeae]